MHPEIIATEFLNQWEREHATGKPNYTRLMRKFAVYGDSMSMDDATAVSFALHQGRVARGWPDPEPAPPGRFSIEPTIEGAILSLWLCGLRSSELQSD
jgi:hypothetical protein